MSQPARPTERGRTEAASRFERLKTLLQVDPQNARLLADCLAAALEAGDFDFVLERTRQGLAKSPSDTRLRFDRASALIGKRDYADAAHLLEELAVDLPDVVAVQINLGLCYYAMGEYTKARAPLERAYGAGDRSVDTLRLLVSTYHHSGLVEEAVAIADANPPTRDCGAGLPGVYALLYIDADQPLPAARFAAQALSANPDSVDGLVVQATLDSARLRIEPARQRYLHALELAPGTGRAWIGLGALALIERNFVQAKRYMERGLQVLPNHTGSWLMLAWVHILTGDIDAAENTIRHTLELDRNFAEAHGALAAVLAMRGDQTGSEHEITIAHRLDPEGLSAQFARSVLMARGGDTSAASKIIEDTLSGLAAGNGVLASALKRATRH